MRRVWYILSVQAALSQPRPTASVAQRFGVNTLRPDTRNNTEISFASEDVKRTKNASALLSCARGSDVVGGLVNTS